MENREVPRIGIIRLRAHLWRTLAEANSEEEGGSWGKHGSPHATEPKAKEAA
jgi:hypothetical protein